MITAIILVYTALIFALGAITGSLKRRGEEPTAETKPTAEFNTEILNFLNYDGTDQ
ncbi:MAG: hypothetical protein IIW94_03785 [Clostridia bacterium]|nr:hypothetical protein [Clostridia bacterium]